MCWLYFYTLLLILVLEFLNDYLRDIYKETRYSHHTEWPPDQPKSVVSNTLIHYKDKRTERELFDISLDRNNFTIGELASSHPTRVTRSIAGIFESPDQKFILIEGAPGIGKTVLAKEIVYLWATHKLFLDKRVILLLARDPNLHAVCSVNELILYLNFTYDCFNDTQINVAANELKLSKGQNIVFVIDGYDECPMSSKLQSFIEKLVKHEKLPKSVVIITSRPHSSYLLRKLADKRVEILGFAEKERDEYISESLKMFPDKKAELEKYLKLQPIISSIMHVPLNLALLLYLFKEDCMPETLTELNEQFIIHTIYRHLQKQCLKSSFLLNDKIEKIADLPKPVLKIVNQLAKLAMSGLDWPEHPDHEKLFVFSYKDVKSVCPEIDKIPNGFGLLQAVHHYTLKGAGSTVSFNFLHSTMQEFLAAYYVSTLPYKRQINIAFTDRLSYHVWLMYVGIVGIETDSVIQFQSFTDEVYLFKCCRLRRMLLRNSISYHSKYSDSEISHAKVLFLFQCYIEAKRFSQVPKKLSSVILKDGIIELKGKMNSDCMLSLINFMMRSDTEIKSVYLSYCRIGDKEINILQNFFDFNVEKLASIQHVCLKQNHITSLWGNQYGDNEMSKSGLLAVPSLDLSFNCVRDKGLVRLFGTLHHNKTLLKLDLSHNNISSSGAVIISDCLKNNATLQELNISRNDILDVGVKSISHSLKTNGALKVLIIAHNTITDEGAAEIASAINLNTTLCQLDISRNFIERKGIMDILMSCSKTATLQRLDCIYNTLSESDYLDIIDYIDNKIMVDLIFNTSWNSIAKGHIRTTMCYCNDTIKLPEGPLNSMQTRGNDEHMESHYADPSINPTLWDKVILCCVKQMSLETLNLSKCTYKTLTFAARAIEINKAISKLHIEHTHIDQDEAVAINGCLQLNTLMKLHFSNCDFGNQTLRMVSRSVICSTTLSTLSISNNVISDDDMKLAGACLKDSKFLQELNMICTKMSNEGAKIIGDSLKTNNALIALNIADNIITNKGATEIANGLKSNITLGYFNVSRNFIEKEGIMDILISCQTFGTLIKLDCIFNTLSQSDFKAIVEYILINKTIHIFNASWNWIDFCERLQHTICQQIKTTICNYKEGHDVRYHEYTDYTNSPYSRNSIEPALMDRVIHCCIMDGCSIIHLSTRQGHTTELLLLIAKAVHINKVLTELHVEHFCISNEKALAIRNCLAVNTMKELHVSDCTFSCQSLEIILQAVKQSHALTKLAICNTILSILSDNGMQLISECLDNNEELRELSLVDTKMTDNGVKSVSISLRNNHILKVLDIADNTITNKGAADIADAIKCNTTLLHLNISKNFIEKEGILDIIVASTTTKTLQRLDCVFNTLSQSDFMAITDYIRIHKVVHLTINTSWNRLSLNVLQWQTPIETIVYYQNGHSEEICDCDVHSKSPYSNESVDQVNIHKVLHCCIKCTCVKELVLRGSDTVDILTATAEAIQFNNALTKLHIHDFHICDIIAKKLIICLTSLKEFHLSRCNDPAKTIAEAIKCNTSLRKLSISDSTISEDNMESVISNCLKHNNTLQELIMVNIGMTDKGASLIAEGILFNTTLLILDISKNKLTDLGIFAISDSLKHTKSLQELKMLQNHKITIAGIKYLAECIKTNTTLVKVEMISEFWRPCLCDLGFHDFDFHEFGFLHSRLRNPNCLSVKELSKYYQNDDVSKKFLVVLELNQLLPKAIIINANILDDRVANCLQNNKVLQEFILLHCNMVSSEIIEKIKKEVPYNSHNDFVKDVIRRYTDSVISNRLSKMVEAFKGTTTLQTLAVTRCGIQDEGAAVISDYIMHNTTIRKLDLSHNFITCKGAIKIFKAVKVSQVMQTLDISSNEISYDGALAIRDCLNQNTSLQSLNIAHNELHNGIIAISDCLNSSAKLRELCLTANYINDESANKLAADIIRANSSIHTLAIGHTPAIGVSSDHYSFNRVILSAIALYDNKLLTNLMLSLSSSTDVAQQRCVLQNEVEIINLLRRSQEVDKLTVTFINNFENFRL